MKAKTGNDPFWPGGHGGHKLPPVGWGPLM